MNETSKRFLSIFGLILITIIWGLTFIYVKWATESLGIYYFLFLRFGIAAIFLAIFFFKQIINVTKETLKASFLLGAILFISYAAQTESLQYTSASNTALITGLYLILTPLFSFVFLKERQKKLVIAGAIISVIGLYLLTNYSISGINVGDLLAIACAAGYSWHFIFTGKYTHRHKLIPLVVFQLFYVAIFSGIIALAKEEFTTNIEPIAWFTIAITAIFASALAFIVQTAAQRHINPTRTGIIFALEAVFGALFGYLIGGEKLTELSFVGAALMTSGMVIAEIRPMARLVKEKILG